MTLIPDQFNLTATESLIIIKPVAHKVFDAFWAKGWEGWSRFEKKYFNGKLHLNLIKGNPMPKDLFRQLYESLVK